MAERDTKIAVHHIFYIEKKLLEEAALLYQAAVRTAGVAPEQLQDALDEVGLCPVNLPERVARHKLIEELLDRIVERGFLTLGDLRDMMIAEHNV